MYSNFYLLVADEEADTDTTLNTLLSQYLHPHHYTHLRSEIIQI